MTQQDGWLALCALVETGFIVQVQEDSRADDDGRFLVAVRNANTGGVVYYSGRSIAEALDKARTALGV